MNKNDENICFINEKGVKIRLKCFLNVEKDYFIRFCYCPIKKKVSISLEQLPTNKTIVSKQKNPDNVSQHTV